MIKLILKKLGYISVKEYVSKLENALIEQRKLLEDIYLDKENFIIITENKKGVFENIIIPKGKRLYFARNEQCVIKQCYYEE